MHANSSIPVSLKVVINFCVWKLIVFGTIRSNIHNLFSWKNSAWFYVVLYSTCENNFNISHLKLMLKETRNSYFYVTPKNHLLMFFYWEILKSTVTKKVIVHPSVTKTFKSSSFCNIFNFYNGFVWSPSKVQGSLFERITRFL